MPYFKWSGVNLVGQLQRGKLFAKSKIQLDEQLLGRHIALLSCKPIRMASLFSRINLGHKLDFFRQLKVLVSAGVLLPKALTIVADQLHHPRLQAILHILADRVYDGGQLSDALSDYPKIFDSMIVQLVRVGEESGSLPMALEVVCDYLETNQDFYDRVRAALFMPIMTLCFFALLCSVVFVVIVPRFADMFASLGQELPALTQTMMHLSNFMASWHALWIFGMALLMGGAFKIYMHTESGMMMLQACVLKLPWVRTLVANRFMSHFLQSIALLCSGGMRLVPALRAVERTISNYVLRDQVHMITNDVQGGASLAEAMSYYPESVFSPDLIAIIHVGEQAGTLDVMLRQAAIMYRNKVKNRLIFFATLVNPILLIIIGLLVAMLIFTVYMPILSMSYAA